MGAASAASGGECASEPLGTYTLSLHIAAIFIVLGVALLGTALPVIARSHPRWRIPDFGFLIGKTFGTGVILATGFVHMMSPAQDVLTSPCLSAEFNENYRAYAGMIALFSALTTHLIQTLAIQHFSTRKGRVKGSTAGDTGAVQAKVPDVASSSTESVNDVTASQTPGVRFDSLADHNYTLSKRADVRHSDDYGEHGQSEHLTVHRHWAENEDHRDSCGHAHASRRHSHSQAGPLPPRLSSAHAINDTTDSHYHTVELGALTTATNIHSDGCCDVDHLLLSHNHRQITAYVLELGIALHSLIIGLTLGVAADAEFLTLLVALSFHQFFEGFALSMTALDAGFRTKRVPIIMAVAYTLTTPIGVSIGVAISATYHADAVDALLTQGILDAVSAGILIYDALVNLLTVNVTHSDYFSSLTNVRKTMVMLSLWSGAGIMSLIGRWA